MFSLDWLGKLKLEAYEITNYARKFIFCVMTIHEIFQAIYDIVHTPPRKTFQGLANSGIRAL